MLFILSAFLGIILPVVLLVGAVIRGYFHSFYFLTGFLRSIRKILIFLICFILQLLTRTFLLLLIVFQLIPLGFSG